MSVGWEDFPVGRRIVTPAVTITETHVVQFATLTGDWYPLHMNEQAAAAGPFGGRIAHGPLTFAMAVGLMYQSQIYGDGIIAWLGADKLRATEPVRFGDTVHVEASVLISRQSKDPSRGVVTLAYVVVNQHSKPVFSCEFSLLMKSARE
ncbi:MAG TPA: MaoC/PaaZ C-terminal domain-containing protein [Steroidobacteraceae bacterium]|nr:MaoC/PaaZ C-terminal domain-containing protein [Steroidobacteraceae bacterium]